MDLIKTYRQGECFLIEIDNLPKGLKEKNKVLAEGETTGHKHLLNGQVQVFADSTGQQFVNVEAPSRLVHEEHQELEIPVGKFKVVLQREYDLLSESIRQVLD